MSQQSESGARADEKLVRDRIPELARANDSKATFRTAEQGEVRGLLHRKLGEECEEAAVAGVEGILDELADVLEVVYALAASYGYSETAVDLARSVKRFSRGGFGGRQVMRKAAPSTD